MPAHARNSTRSNDNADDARALRARVGECLLADRRRIQRRIRRTLMRARSGQPVDRSLERIRREIDASAGVREARRRAPLEPAPPPDLPILARKQEIIEAIRDHQVVVVCGETGSGKTTQLPRLCLELGRGIDGMIGHTQPRRIAAQSVAARIAEELGVQPGSVVGSRIRFADRTSDTTRIKVMTDGILLAETRGDRRLEQYDTLIIDEAHERSLNIDFLLGYIARLLPKRPELRVVITSATIDPERFSEHFAGAPIIEVSGRTYPVEVRYRPLELDSKDDESPEIPPAQSLLDAIGEVTAEGPGDVLIFLPTERAILETARILRRSLGDEADVLPLYARLPQSEQRRIFAPHTRRRIVLATNVAETSLTVPGIRAVIDTGLARISRYSSRRRILRLPIERVSKASAEQRKGRCGRIGPGVCIRLYDEQDYEQREEYTPPEILRTNLAGVVLQMKALGLGDLRDFPLIDQPRPAAVREALDALHELHAIDERGELTEIGRGLARLPVDPRIGRMILEGAELGQLEQVLVIGAGLSVQDPRVRPPGREAEADARHALFADDRSDFITLLNLWDRYHEQREHLSRRQLERWCRDQYLSPNRLREWSQTVRQIRDLARESAIKGGPRREDDHGAIHRALLTGLISGVGKRVDVAAYRGPSTAEFFIFPGSAVFESRPKWIMCAEMTQTTRLYGRMVSSVNPKWIERAAAHLIRREHSEPEWDPRRGAAFATERVTIGNLELARGRRVEFSGIDTPRCRELFIHAALVEGDSDISAPFLRHNRSVVEQLRDLEARTRTRGYAPSAEALADFYDQRIPEHVCTVKGFESWRRKAEKRDPRLLFAGPEDLVSVRPGDVADENYPDRVRSRGRTIPVEYRFDPGDVRDGLTLTIPAGALFDGSADDCASLVPGWRAELIAEMIRLLPRDLRRRFVPAPDFARRCLERVSDTGAGFFEEARRALEQIGGARIPSERWNPDNLPGYLRPTYRVVDASGRELAESKDTDHLREHLSDHMRRAVEQAGEDTFSRRAITTWDFDDLPESVEVDSAGATVTAYPALVDEGDSCALRLIADPDEARRLTRDGVRRLLAIALKRDLKLRMDDIPGSERIAMNHALVGSADDLRRGLYALIADDLFLSRNERVRTFAGFQALLDEGWNDMERSVNRIASLVDDTLSRHRAAIEALDRVRPEGREDSVEDIRRQLGALVFPGFLSRIPLRRLRHYPRYLEAVVRRIEKLASGDHERDRRLMLEVVPWVRAFVEAAQATAGRTDPALEELRWMIEEYRVSLFAQELGTAKPVSDKRLRQQWDAVRTS